jgi:hypothetical protein
MRSGETLGMHVRTAKMAADLYKDDFSRIDDTDVFRAIEAFTRISEPMDVRPRESFVLDFKEEWSDGALHTVAGFAHTFGGLLIVGISENKGQPDNIVGIDSPGELKTRIASSIATNISPTPPYEIAECNLPTQAGRKLAVVRVRQGHQLYYCTKKGDRPIYVRNEDQSVPADAAQLRSLIERKTSASQTQSDVTNRINGLRPSVQLRRTAEMDKAAGIPTSLQIILSPFDHPGLTLDSSAEQQFRKLINQNFSFRYCDTDCEKEEERWVDWYEWRWFRLLDKHESVWRITSYGDVVYMRQARVRVANIESPNWSLGDTIADVLLLLGVVRSLWKSSGFYGEAQLVISLNVRDLHLHTDLTSEVRRQATPDVVYAMQDFNLALRDSVVSFHSGPSGGAGATGVFNSGLPYDAVSDAVANVMNQLLRCLMHSANLQSLRLAVDSFFRVVQ